MLAFISAMIECLPCVHIGLSTHEQNPPNTSARIHFRRCMRARYTNAINNYTLCSVVVIRILVSFTLTLCSGRSERKSDPLDIWQSHKHNYKALTNTHSDALIHTLTYCQIWRIKNSRQSTDRIDTRHTHGCVVYECITQTHTVAPVS